jgi:lipoyl(octanoyl) transferase
MHDRILIRKFDITEFAVAYTAMTRFNAGRQLDSIDELWCLQHSPVYTLGLAGRAEYIHHPGQIPVVNTDRGGQVTYHGPGQLIVYLLIDLKRKGFMVKQYVKLIEQSLIDMCTRIGLPATRRAGAPGVYINDKKVAALGIRVKKGCTYHGLALNVNMYLAPFQNIDPCGFPGLEVTQLSDEGCDININEAFENLLPCLLNNLDYRYTIYPDSNKFPICLNTHQAA